MRTPETAEAAAKGSSAVAAVLGGTSPKDLLLAAAMNPQHLIVSGQGALPADSLGNRWTAGYITASGNLLADFRMNVTAESQGRVQVARLYNMTDDPGVRDLLKFLLARDTMHQNMWLAAIEELEADGLELDPCPSNFPQSEEHTEFSYQYLKFSEGTDTTGSRWTEGSTPDGKGEFRYMGIAEPHGQIPDLAGGADPKYYGTPPVPLAPDAAQPSPGPDPQ